jgi:hydrogenase maturation protease
VKVIEFSGDGTSLINAWDENARVILIERVLTQTSPGTIVAIDLLHGSFPHHWRPTTNNVKLEEAVELARVMGRLPNSLMLYGIQGGSLEHGPVLSPEVRVAVEKVAAMIELDLLDALDRS